MARRSGAEGSSPTPVHVVGGGLAGSEAAWQLARRGIPTVLHEMRPARSTPAHQGARLCELVCSNSLGSCLDHTAPGVFKAELALLGSLVVSAAHHARVPAGGALAVDREAMSGFVEARLAALPTLEIRRDEVARLPEEGEGTWIFATGPLTSPSLAGAIQARLGRDYLYFYDAIAPIVEADTVDRSIAFRASRYDQGSGDGDYLNCPMDRDQYEAFVDLVLAADQVPAHAFEQERFFGGCQPIEAIARSGRDSLRFGPMKPVGLVDPRTGRRPYAVVQLRQENLPGSALNIVGFQTRMRYPDQKRVLRTVPGLEAAEFVRLGSVHRNTFIDTPHLLGPDLALGAAPYIRFAGQIVGCEGYTESSAMGLVAALHVAAEVAGKRLSPPPGDTMLGSLLAYLRAAPARGFQPMNVNFGLVPDLAGPVVRDKKERRRLLGRRALESMASWARSEGVYDPLALAPGPGVRASDAAGNVPA